MNEIKDKMKEIERKQAQAVALRSSKMDKVWKYVDQTIYIRCSSARNYRRLLEHKCDYLCHYN